MLLNYLKLSFRLLARNPFFTLINVVGLAIGFASFYALWEYATTELKSDQYHTDANRIARICVNWHWSDDQGKTWGSLVIGGAKPSLIPQFGDDFPDIESTLRIAKQQGFNDDLVGHGSKVVVTIGNQTGQPRIFKEEKVAYADANLFTFFTIPLVYGQGDEVLKGVNNVVLSESISEKYFGKKDPRGELIRLNDSTTLTVSGVYKDLPHYSHLNFELVISNAGLLNKWNIAGLKGWPLCYVKVRNGDFKTLEAKLNAHTREHWAELFREWPAFKLDVFLQPLEEIAFSQNFLADNFYPKSKPFLLTLAFIAISVLVMAWVNYVNLSVTRTTRRAKEIATRKVSGARSIDMAAQFVTESLITNMLAISVAATLIQIVRRPVAALFNIQIDEFSSLSSGSIAIFLVIIIGGVLLSGLYPAIISATYQPRALFKLNAPARGQRFIPSLLTVSQLVVAIIFVLLGFTVSHQLNHVMNMNTGINKNEVIVLDAPVIKPNNYQTILNSFGTQLGNISNVTSVTFSRSDLTELYSSENPVVKRIGADHKFGMDGNTVDENYLPFYGLKVIAGRNFIDDDRRDDIVISRFATTRLGFASPDDAVGVRINLTIKSGLWKEAEVIGVFEDFRQVSFLNMSKTSSEANDQGRGIVLMYKNQFFGDTPSSIEKISVRILPQNLNETIASIQTLYDQQFPGNAFSWYFLSEHANQVYFHEQTTRNQIVLFTTMAIFIACLGLLGMISVKVVEKTKEIGIRKVLGAKLHQIAQILVNTTAKHITLASIIAIPIGYYLTQQYLEKFSERISLQWWHFALPVLILMTIMFSTIASVLWKAARSNPVEALKYE